MNIYIQEGNKFVKLSLSWDAVKTVSDILEFVSVFNRFPRFDTVHFVPGDRVWFEGMEEWTEVKEAGCCDECVVPNDICKNIVCAAVDRGDSGIHFRKLSETDEPEKSPEPKIINNCTGGYAVTIGKPKSAGLKYDSGKTRPGLIPPECLKAIAEVLTFGANKYAPDNWKQVDPERYVDALWRHYIAWKTGEEKDAESGLAHVAHFATNALFLLWFEIEKNKKEDERK